MSDRIDTDELRRDAAWLSGKLGPVGGGRAARMRAAADEIDRLRGEITAFRRAARAGVGPSCEDVCMRESSHAPHTPMHPIPGVVI